MLAIYALIGLMAACAIAEIKPQTISIDFGNTHITGLMRDLAAAQKAGDTALIASLREKIKKARDGPDESKWYNDQSQFTVSCSISATFDAEIYVADIDNPHPQIAWAMPKLDAYWKSEDGTDMPYTGDFEKFMHQDGFRIIRVDYEELPWAVKRWRKEQQVESADGWEKKFIAVVDGVAFFSPGVVTYLLPLFAGRNVVLGKNGCEDQLVDLRSFKEKDKNPNENFLFDFGGRSEVGNSLKIQAVAEKRIRKNAEEKRKPEEEATKEAKASERKERDEL